MYLREICGWKGEGSSVMKGYRLTLDRVIWQESLVITKGLKSGGGGILNGIRDSPWRVRLSYLTSTFRPGKVPANKVD